jgi:hypothetical protein
LAGGCGRGCRALVFAGLFHRQVSRGTMMPEHQVVSPSSFP